jgi:hypothetical protein
MRRPLNLQLVLEAFSLVVVAVVLEDAGYAVALVALVLVPDVTVVVSSPLATILKVSDWTSKSLLEVSLNVNR